MIDEGPDACLNLDLAMKDLSFAEKERYFRATLEHIHVENYMTYMILTYKLARQLRKLAQVQSVDTLQGTGEARRQIKQARDLLL